MTIGIIVAMSSEQELVSHLLANKTVTKTANHTFTEGAIGTHRIILLQSGIGKVCAAVGAVELIRAYQPDCIINSGVAGSLDKTVGVMDVVVGERTVYHDVDCFTDNPHGQIQGLPLYFEADPKLLKAAAQLAVPQKVHIGLTCSGDQFISNYETLQTIKNYFPEGLAVDMESCAIAHVCYMYQVPFLSLRIISDTPGITDHETQYFDFWKEAPKTSLAVIEQMLTNLN